MMTDARSRHVVVNKLLKDYNMLQNTYRGQLEWYHYVFGTVANGSLPELCIFLHLFALHFICITFAFHLLFA